MGIFDSIRSAFNPSVVEKYKNLVNNHSEAFYRWKGKQVVGTLSKYFDFDPTYSDKVYIASHEREILAFEQVIAEEKAFIKRRQQVIKAASDYPHAFVALLKELSISPIPGVSATLPGQRKSKRAARIEREKRKNVSNSFFSASQIISRFESSTSFFPQKGKRSINNLSNEEHEKIFKKIGRLSSDEDRIKKELQKEDSIIQFEDEVLDNEIRAKYYRAFCKSKSVTSPEESIKLYCVAHLTELDRFAKSEIDREYNALRLKYSNGLNSYENSHRYMSRFQLISHENDIKTYDANFTKANSYTKWENEQKDFAKECRDLRDSKLSSYGCYVYTIPFDKFTLDGKTTRGTYRVWQMFCESFCDVEGLDYQYYSSVRDNYAKLSGAKSLTRYFYNKVYDKIIDYIMSLKASHSNIAVVIGDSSMGVKVTAFNKYHFSYFVDSLKGRNIPVFDIDEIEKKSNGVSYLVVVEVITSNEHLVSVCKRIIESNEKASPKISYISLYKGYDKKEMIELINQEKRKIEKAQQAQKEEEARKERELREKKQLEQDKDTLRTCVHSWPQPNRSVVRCFSLYNYYPTTCDWNASEDEWDVRNLIWDFKANPNRPQSELEIKNRHERAVSEVLPNLNRLLTKFFGNKKSKLTLVCIPSSKKIITERRYKDFSEKICKENGMANGYPYVHVTEEGEASHLGGVVQAKYSVDSSFFKDRFVILFDDVITSGKSMERFKQLLESAGATVIAGISIGKTRHERQSKNPIDIL